MKFTLSIDMNKLVNPDSNKDLAKILLSLAKHIKKSNNAYMNGTIKSNDKTCGNFKKRYTP
jgi:hypothetical protein